MKIVSRCLVMGLCFWGLGATAAESAKKEKTLSPAQEELKKYTVSLLEASRKVNDADKKVMKASRSMIETSMNWTEVARQCLGDSVWKKTSAKNRRAFEDLLKDVVILTAFQRLDKFWTDNTSYTFPKVKVAGEEGYVSAEFDIDGDEFLLEYFFKKYGKDWKIIDISFEELRYSENIREQIQAFLRESNFSTLLGKLRKRKAELLSSAPDKSEKKGKS